MGCSPECEIAIDYEYDRFTHPLPRTVLTVSKCDVLTFEARPIRYKARGIRAGPWHLRLSGKADLDIFDSQIGASDRFLVNF
jgi:hypothetical protein